MITRAQWVARPPKGTPARVPPAARTATCVHHDGPRPVVIRTLAEACALMRRDQDYHMNHNGWADIGYNYLVASAPGTPIDGLVFEGRGRDIIGAHCLNHNTEWIGIQVAIGGGQTPSPAALASVRYLHDTFVVAAGHGLAMKGHRDGFNTACPDPKLYAWVKAGMPVAAVRPPAPVVSRSTVRAKIAAIFTRPKYAQLKVDGDLGPATMARLGAVLKNTYNTVAAMQRYLRVESDGIWGRLTTIALQRHYGLTADGVLTSALIKVLQQHLNNNRF